ncbi:MAG: UTP--glucose-1-phosphate uridylyltransferase [Demequinaceae bacterium]|nr:UTP--glucose-1-phosphate uridylyltransferase [Demequinaceae bacterium]
MAQVRKAVIPAAGRGTRFLPASKAIPKELIPVIDRPSVQYVVEEALAAGLSDVALVLTGGKEAVAEHFAPDAVLEAHLKEKGEKDFLDEVRRTSGLGPLTYLVQDVPDGLGKAVGVAEEYVGKEPFVVMLGDDFCDERDPALPTMIALHECTGMSVVLLMEVPSVLLGVYGSVDPFPLSLDDIPGADRDPRIPDDAEVHRLLRLNEKPARGEEYSNLAVIGRYLFTPAVFDAIRETPPGRNGETQLTDAIDRLTRVPVDEGGGVLGLVFRGRRYDTGDKLEYLKAVVTIAVDRPDLGPAFRKWLDAFVSDGKED